MREKLTKAQIKVLIFLAGRGPAGARPSEIGVALDDGTFRGGLGLTSQGAGRLGGGLANRLVRMGLAQSAATRNGGFSAYAITPAGRAALQPQEDGE